MKENYKLFILITIVILSPICAHAMEVNIAKLAGKSQKTWQVEAIDVSLGSGNKCSKGRQYLFKIDHTVEVKACINSILQVTTYPWDTNFDGIDTYITFDERSYRLIYSKRINTIGIEEEELVLRKEGTKNIATYDIIMSYIP